MRWLCRGETEDPQPLYTSAGLPVGSLTELSTAPGLSDLAASCFFTAAVVCVKVSPLSPVICLSEDPVNSVYSYDFMLVF